MLSDLKNIFSQFLKLNNISEIFLDVFCRLAIFKKKNFFAAKNVAPILPYLQKK